ncbi:hydrogenase maturation protease [Elusimicrobiota bacterium]
MEKEIPEYCQKPVLILGCGNVMLGDEGFGPAVIKHLEKGHAVPKNVFVVNARAQARPLLFNITLSPKKPERIILIGAFASGKTPGEIFEADITGISHMIADDYSLHQIPTQDILKDLRDNHKIEIIVLACQVGKTTSEMTSTLSAEVEAAIPHICEILLKKIS